MGEAPSAQRCLWSHFSGLERGLSHPVVVTMRLGCREMGRDGVPCNLQALPEARGGSENHRSVEVTCRGRMPEPGPGGCPVRGLQPVSPSGRGEG